MLVHAIAKPRQVMSRHVTLRRENVKSHDVTRHVKCYKVHICQVKRLGRCFEATKISLTTNMVCSVCSNLIYYVAAYRHILLT